MTTLAYKPHGRIEDLEVGECTMHRAANDRGGCWWLLWFRVNREDNGQPADFAVPMNPRGGFVEDGPGGKTWGLTMTSPGVWQVAPSINVLASRAVHPGAHAEPSQWHQTPSITGVTSDEAWATGAAP